MPIYMDRHDVSETVTAEIVAQLHQEDLKIQDRFQCRGLTYWFDDKRKTAFCLVEAPDEEAIRTMHKVAHGEVPNQIIEVDPHIVESFLGRIGDPEKAKNPSLNIINDPAFRTVMVIGLKITSLKQSGAAQYQCSLQDFNRGVLNILSICEGALVKQAQNYFLVSFKSVSKAVQAALDIKRLFNKFRSKLPNELSLKIGLSAGPPVSGKKSFFEDPIILAERMCKTVKGEIILSSEVRELYNSENSNVLNAGENIYFLSQNDERFLSLLMDYTESAWDDTHLKVEHFSKPLGCSESQLYRKMISLTGKSLHTFIKEYRLNEALILLNKKNRNISEVAYETGFTSPSYFSKCFQKKYGHPPSGYS